MDDNAYSLFKASEWSFIDSVIINNLDDLKALAKQHESDLIVNFDDRKITIYDDYVE